MRLESYFRFVERTHAWLPPAMLCAASSLVFALALAISEGGFVRDWLVTPQLAGTLLTFIFLPAYLLGTCARGYRLGGEVLEDLASIAEPADIERVRHRLMNLDYAMVAIVFGVVVGIALNPDLFLGLIGSGGANALDVSFLLGACFTWFAIGWMLCWRLPISAAFSRLGANARLDLYRLDRVRPLARVANTDLLIVAGAAAFTPLQSLDAQFRLSNYLLPTLVGVPAAIVLFVWPLLGVRAQIIRSKRERLESLYAAVEATDRDDVAGLEAVVAHVDRVKSLSPWPIDFELVTRVCGYVIIPPLAWVAAALVERFIDRLTG